MKKILPLFLITILSFSFFACASSSKAEDEVPQSDILEEVTDNLSETKTDENTDSVEIETTDEVFPDAEDSDENVNFEELEDIVEPEVIDILELPEVETDITNQQEDYDSSEMINPDELDELSEEDLTLETPSTEENEIVEVLDSEGTANSENDDITVVENTENGEIVDDFEDIIVEVQNPTEESVVSSESENAQTEDSIDIIDETEENQEEETPVEAEIKPSRTVELKKGEYLDVIYPGTGWVYVGLIDGSKDVTYNGRRLGTTNTTFTLIAKKEGTFVVHFYKNDNLTGDYIDDYLEIKVSAEKTTSKVHKIAPDYSVSVPPKPRTKEEIKAKKDLEKELKETANSEVEEKPVEAITPKVIPLTEEKTDSSQKFSYVQEAQKETEIVEPKTIEKPKGSFNSNKTPQKQTAKKPVVNVQSEDDDIEVLDKGKPDLSAYDSIDPETVLQQAYAAYNEKSFADALKYISDFISMSNKKIDEAYFLKGQVFEAQSGIQNINNAVKAYETVINNYPASKYWDKANKRIIYLKRFYLEVR